VSHYVCVCVAVGDYEIRGWGKTEKDENDRELVGQIITDNSKIESGMYLSAPIAYGCMQKCMQTCVSVS